MKKDSIRIVTVFLIFGGSICFLLASPAEVLQAETAAVDTQLGAHLKGIDPDSVDWKSKTIEYWRRALTPEQFAVCREGGTERAYTGHCLSLRKPGVYRCSSCGQALFSSERKFESGTGWPSFGEPITPDAIVNLDDRSHGMVRTEVRCSRCSAHLGHVFDDGPPPSGKRYCMNAVCLLHSEPNEKPAS